MRQLGVLVLLFLAACGQVGPVNTEKAKGYTVDRAEQCVPFARRISGIQIYGNAHTWWHKASPEKRSKQPKEGAVLVLAKSRRLRLGHLAVVKDILSDREIEVTHSNWGNSRKKRRIIYERHRVQDLSKRNDWSRARFWNPHHNSWGLPYEVSGFIYP